MKRRLIMKRLRIGKNTINMKLTFYFIVILLVPILFFSVFLQKAYEDGVQKLARTTVQESLDIVNYNLERQFDEYENLTYFISRDRQLQDLSYYKNAEEFNKTKNGTAINGLLNSYRTSVAQISQVSITYKNGMTISTDLLEAVEKGKKYPNEIREDNSEHIHILTDWNGEEKNSGVETISICRAMYNDSGVFAGVIEMVLYYQVLEQAMSNILSRNGSYLYIVDNRGKILYSPVFKEIPSEVYKPDYCKLTVHNERNDWDIIGAIPMKPYLSQIYKVKQILLFMLILIAFIFVGGLLKVSSSIVKPIESLRLLMKRAEAGDLTVRYQQKAPDEIEDLGKSFNIMIVKLNELIQRVYKEQKEKRKAEMAALQANIKPHFLYNTLDTIHWMAKEYQADDIAKTVDALSNLFRIALSKGSENITISQEIHHVRSYLQIQKVRYEEMITYDIKVDEDCEHLLVQKLILQPLVENSIYHGIKQSRRNGKIAINVWKEEEEVYFSVEDNGLGMTPERLERIKEAIQQCKTEKDGAYGLVNVHQRILLNYGEPFGVYIESRENEGTLVLVRHPILTEEMK